MDSITLQAKSLEEAARMAAEKLGVKPEDLDVVILEEGKGLFGKPSLRVRATVRATVPTPEPAAEPSPAEQGAPPPAAESAEETAPPSAAEAEPDAAPVEFPLADEAEEPAEDLVATEEEAQRLLEMAEEVLSLAHLHARIKVKSITGRYVNLELEGRDVAYLVGKHGEVLNALQYLLNLMAHRRMDRDVRLTLDANQYRRRREEALRELATRVAEEVRARKEEAVLDALPSFERRVVHRALAGVPGVTTYSEGEEPNRRVVIAPADE